MQHSKSRFIAAAVFAFTVLAGCAPEWRTPATECFPAAARPWIPMSAGEVGAATRGPTQVYVDASMSMRGYLAAETGALRPRADLIATAPWREASGQVSYFLFGDDIRPVETADLPRLHQAGAYDARVSRIDDVLERIAGAADPDGLAVVITDMWLSNPDNAESDSTAMGEPLRRILASGRGVAVYGVRAPYEGEIYDLPGDRRGVRAAARPLYLLAIGSPARLEALDRRLRRSASAGLRQGFQEGSIRRALFAVEGGRPVAPEAEPLAGDLIRAGLTAERLEGAPAELRIPVYRYSAGDVIGAPEDLAWTEPEPADGLVRAARDGPEARRVRVWSLDGHPCGGSSEDTENWTDWGALEGRWTRARDGRLTLGFHPARDAQGMSAGDYLVLIEVLRAPLEGRSTGAEWMRHPDWSLEGDDASVTAALSRPDRLMPTLGLSQTAWALEDALDQVLEARAEPPAVSGAAFMLTITD